MKSRIVIKLALILVFGGLFGLVTQHGHEKWHRLGRAAYLAQQADWFDRKMATPSNPATQVIEWALVASIIGGAYEGAALICATLIERKPPAQQPSAQQG